MVTGGSRGIGAAIARQAAISGYAVIVNYSQDEQSAQLVVDDIIKSGGRACAVKADVGIDEDVERLFKTCDAEFGAPTLLVNNAGITGGFARVEDIDPVTLGRVFQTNTIGPFLCARQAIRRMSRSQGGLGGVIINISSRAASLGGAGEWVHYAATKGALDTFTIGLAREVAEQGIRVNAVAVGFVETELHAAAGTPERAAEMSIKTPMGRVGQADEVANAVLWLASGEASYTTGSILAVSGGR